MSKKELPTWAQAKEQSFHFSLINQYAVYKHQTDDSTLSDRTLTDLDFHDFFKFVDRTSSAVGQQYLFDQFIQNSFDYESLLQQEDLVNHYQTNQELRIKSQKLLFQLSKGNDYYFPFLIFGELPEKSNYLWLVKILQVLSLASCIIAIKYPVFIFVLMFLFTINLGMHYFNKQRIGKFTVYFSRLTKLSDTLNKLLPHSNYRQASTTQIKSDIRNVEKITSKILFLKTDNLQDSEFGFVAWFIVEIFKILSLSEITTFHKVIDKIIDCRESIENVFINIGKIDTAISICSLRDGLEYYAIPEFLDKGKEIELDSLTHPLIKNCIENDLMLKNKSLLLTGSNMAGKSSFIKAINLSVLSSQVLNTSFAKAYKAPPLKIMTSMTIKDDLENDSSYYMEEVDSIHRLIEASGEEQNQYLFTIDEIFKGTNTVERISTAKAILEFLNKNNHLVLVSTHDIELTKLLDDKYEFYYFQEDLENNKLGFDYKLKKGILKKSNAIKILEISGYPKDITDEARRLVEEMIT